MPPSRRFRFFIPVITGLLCALVMEALLRALFPQAVPRTIVLTNSTFFVDDRGVPRLRPRQQVRAILMADGRPEFDVRFPTNNLGFIDHRDYGSRADGRGLAFVGDSFTAGVEGGTPWIPALRDVARRTAPDLEMFNFGMGGAGVAQFAQLLDSAAHDLAFDAIAILAISDDFNRPPWVTLRTDDELRLCTQGQPARECLGRPPIAYVIDGDETSGQLTARVAGSPPLARIRTVKDVLRQSRLLLLTKRSWDRFGPIGRGLYAQNVAALAATRQRFPTHPIYFVHLPQKEEVRAGRYFQDVRADVENAGIRYLPALTECTWSEDLFYAIDAHPNARGYLALSDCVSRLVVTPYLNRARSGTAAR
jgi:hypothetical protein